MAAPSANSEPSTGIELKAEVAIANGQQDLGQDLNAETNDDSLDRAADQGKRGYQFWGIISALCVTGILSSLENTVVSTSLPTIVHDLNIGDNYIWITNIFFLTG